MRSIRLAALAETDLIDIWRYTAERWDAEQADDYLNAIDRGIRNLVEHPEVGVGRDDVRVGYRVLFVNHHAIYYMITPSVIRVIRVLHGRMDPQRHL